MKYCIKKIDTAVEQLDWAIRLFLDHKAYVSAITLAGAAEEVIGETLGDNSIFRELRKSLAKEYGLEPKVVAEAHLNKAKNWLKHWKDCKDDECIEINLENEAMQYIIRAIANLVSPDRPISIESNRFLNWLYENRKDLL